VFDFRHLTAQRRVDIGNGLDDRRSRATCQLEPPPPGQVHCQLMSRATALHDRLFPIVPVSSTRDPFVFLGYRKLSGLHFISPFVKTGFHRHRIHRWLRIISDGFARCAIRRAGSKIRCPVQWVGEGEQLVTHPARRAAGRALRSHRGRCPRPSISQKPPSLACGSPFLLAAASARGPRSRPYELGVHSSPASRGRWRRRFRARKAPAASSAGCSDRAPAAGLMRYPPAAADFVPHARGMGEAAVDLEPSSR